MGLTQPFFSYSESNLGTGTSARYFPTLSARWAGTNTVSGQAEQPVAVAGTIRKWRVRLTVAPGTGVTRTFTLWKNGSATALTLAITGTDVEGSDLVNTVALAAGDLIWVAQTVSGGTPTDSGMSSVCEIEYVDSTSSMYGFGTATLQGGTGSSYDGAFYGGFWSTQSAWAASLAAADGTVNGYRVHLSTAPGAGASRSFVMFLNGVAQDGTSGTPDTRVTVAETDTTGVVAFSLAITTLDLVWIRQTGNSANTSAIAGSVQFTADNPGQAMFGVSIEGTTQAGTTYAHPYGRGVSWVTDESTREILGPATAIELSGLVVRLTAAPGSGKSLVFTFRVNAADTAQTVTVSDAATSAGPSGGAVVSFTGADRASLKAVETSPITIKPRVQAAFLMTDPNVGPAPSGFNALLVAP